MGVQTATADEIIGRIAASQHGVVTRSQLLSAGLSPKAIAKRLDKGSLIRVHRGIYRVGHMAPNVNATFIAAVYACGEGAVLSGRAAAYLLGLVKRMPPGPEVTTPIKRAVAGVASRQTRSFDPRDVTLYQNIPVTTIPRTLVDLAASLNAAELARAVHEAGIRHGTTPDDVEAVLKRRPNSPGAAALRAVLRGDAHITLSKLEQAFLKLLRNAGLARPVTNRPAGGRFVDCRWPEHKLTVELDSYRYHASRHAWELDRRRERQAYARGDQFRRYTWGDVVEFPRQMLRELRAVLDDH
jgi:predicted transcriptional regulator of viral defense system